MTFNTRKPTVQLLGRFQPWHDGHTALFKKALEKTGQVVIMIRDVEGEDDNPYGYQIIYDDITQKLKQHGYVLFDQYIIMKAPNIVDISYGRDVGYTFTEHDLGAELHKISATKIRNKLREEGKL